MPQPERYEMLVLGSGAGGKLLAWHMAKSGHRMRRRRAQTDRRLLPEHQLPSQQERDLERESRRSGSPRRSVRNGDGFRRHRHEASAGAQARHGRRPDRHAPRPLQGQRRRADHGYGPVHCAEDHRGEFERRRYARADRRSRGLSISGRMRRSRIFQVSRRQSRSPMSRRSSSIGCPTTSSSSAAAMSASNWPKPIAGSAAA